MQNFDATNAVLLAEWIAKEFKHKTLKLIIDTLNHPPITFEEGQVSRNWRLTPDTVYSWVEKRAREAEELRQIEQTRKEQAKLLSYGDLSPEGQQMIKECLERLQSGMFKPIKSREMSPELKRIDLMISLLAQYKKESIDPITGKLYTDAMDEREWLLSKGYCIENGEIKDI